MVQRACGNLLSSPPTCLCTHVLPKQQAQCCKLAASTQPPCALRPGCAAGAANWAGWWEAPSTRLCTVLTQAMALNPANKGKTLLLPCREPGGAALVCALCHAGLEALFCSWQSMPWA